MWRSVMSLHHQPSFSDTIKIPEVSTLPMSATLNKAAGYTDHFIFDLAGARVETLSDEWVQLVPRNSW